MDNIPISRAIGRGRGLTSQALATADLPKPGNEASALQTPTISLGRGRILQWAQGASSGLSSSACSTSITDNNSQLSSSEGPQPPFVVRGRGKLLQSVASSTLNSEVSSTSILPPTASVGRGRGNFLASLGNGSVESHSVTNGCTKNGDVTNEKDRYLPADVSESKANVNGNVKTPEVSISSRLAKMSLAPENPTVDMGKDGRPIPVLTNHILLSFVENKGVYRYMIKFLPSIDSIALRYRLIEGNLPIKRGIRCYDGGDLLFLPERLPQDETNIVCQHPDDGSSIAMKVTFQKHLRMGECLNLIGTLIRNCCKELKLTQFGKHQYDHKSAINIPQHKMQIWPGYVTAVEERENGVYLTCDFLHRVLRFETVYEVLNNHRNNVTSREQWKLRANEDLLGCTVLTHYNNRLYRIDDIAWDMTPLSSFTLEDGSSMTFKEYYLKQYNLHIEDLEQPMIMSRPRRAGQGEENKITILVPELCFLTGITDRMRTDFRVMKDIGQYTRLTPIQRVSCLRKFIESLKANEKVSKMLSEWGLKVPSEGVELTARIMDPVSIRFGDNKTIEANADWGHAARSSTVFRGVDITNWMLVYNQRDSRRADLLRDKLMQCASGMGIRISRPCEKPLQGDRLEVLMRTLQSNVTPDIQIVVVLLQSLRTDFYSAVKKFCAHDRGIASQVVLSNTLAREAKVRPIVQNIALQMIAKLGGALWMVPTPMKRTMVCGIDTYHDKKRNESVGAFVATSDPTFTKYISQAAMQKDGVEILNSLVLALSRALTEYGSNCNALPDRLIIFRDGVDEGSLNLLQYEAEQFKQACLKFNPAYKPNIVMIVVLKRISTRFFVSKGGGVDNPPPGTVLDHSITKRNYRDFLIVSQLVRQGTVTPTHFIVQHDDENMQIDRIQRITYFFSHMYYNWPGTVRVPAPCLYAHKLAGLVGQYMKTLPDSKLNTKLHYL